MSERNLSPNVLTAIAAGVVRPEFFVYADFPSGALRFWTGAGTVSWDGQTWTGWGRIVGFQSFPETEDTSAQGISAQIIGLVDAVLDPILDDDFTGQDCAVWLGFRLADGALEVMSEPLYRGSLDRAEITDQGKAFDLVVNAEHRLADLLRPRTLRYTHQDQQTLYPGAADDGLEFVEAIQDQRMPWGRADD